MLRILGVEDSSVDFLSFNDLTFSEFYSKQLFEILNTSRELDPESPFNYYRARYYSPAMGRFLSEDPIGFKGGDTNLYRYVKNNPVKYVDPSGKNIAIAGAVVCVGTAAILVNEVVKSQSLKACGSKGTKSEFSSCSEQVNSQSFFENFGDLYSIDE